MDQLFQKVISSIHHNRDREAPSSSQATASPSPLLPPTKSDILRYRYHFGTNLGGIFVLEKWLFPSFFPADCQGDAELDAVLHSLRTTNLPITRQKWETHWTTSLSKPDLHWFTSQAHGTSIRLPIGYWDLGAQFCIDTPFHEARDVYVNAWMHIIAMLKILRAFGIGVLIDLHGVYGCANAESHSGVSGGRVGLWERGEEGRNCRERTKEAVMFIVNGVKEEGLGDVLVGVQVCNEAVWGAGGWMERLYEDVTKGVGGLMYKFYDDVIEGVGEVDKNMSIPIYVSDGWDLGGSIRWVKEFRKRMGRRGNPVVVDTHRYYTFSEKDRNSSPHEIINRIPHELWELDGSSEGGVQTIVGEYSCVLDAKTWDCAHVSSEEKENLIREFGVTQCKKWEECKGVGGSYFWTWKMDWMNGGEWGFVEQIEKGNIRAPIYMGWSEEVVRKKVEIAEEMRGVLGERARKGHRDYWEEKCPGKIFRFDLFAEGWELGFEDGMSFFRARVEGISAAGEDGNEGESHGIEESDNEILRKTNRTGVDKLGSVEIWMEKRMRECGERIRGNGREDFLWEWEHGFREGLEDFEECVGI